MSQQLSLLDGDERLRQGSVYFSSVIWLTSPIFWTPPTHTTSDFPFDLQSLITPFKAFYWLLHKFIGLVEPLPTSTDQSIQKESRIKWILRPVTRSLSRSWRLPCPRDICRRKLSSKISLETDSYWREVSPTEICHLQEQTNRVSLVAAQVREDRGSSSYPSFQCKRKPLRWE